MRVSKSIRMLLLLGLAALAPVAPTLADQRAEQELRERQQRERLEEERREWHRRNEENRQQQTREQERELQKRRREAAEREEHQRQQQQALPSRQDPRRQSAQEAPRAATAPSGAAREAGNPLVLVFERFGLRMGSSTLDDVRRAIEAVGATKLRELNLKPNLPGVRLIDTNGATGFGIKDLEKVSFQFDERLMLSAILVHRKLSSPNPNLFDQRFAELRNGREVIHQRQKSAQLSSAHFKVRLWGDESNLWEWYSF